MNLFDIAIAKQLAEQSGGGGGTTYTAGENITIENNVISAVDTTYTAGENITIENNVISASGGGYTLPIASDSELGGVKIGNNLTIEKDGTLNADDAPEQLQSDWAQDDNREKDFIKNKPFDVSNKNIFASDIIATKINDEYEYTEQDRPLWLTNSDIGKEVTIVFGDESTTATVTEEPDGVCIIKNHSIGPTDYPSIYIKCSVDGGVNTNFLKCLLHKGDETETITINEIYSEEFTKLDGNKIKVDNDTININGKGELHANTDPFELLERKVSEWSSTTTDINYPTEKLVKDTIDALHSYVDDQFKAHLLWTGSESAKGVKARNSDGNWNIENLDMTPYKYVILYVQACNGDNQDQEGISYPIRIDLQSDMAAPRTGYYYGGVMSYYPNDDGVKYGVILTIDSTKTKICFNYCLANTMGTTALSRDGKLVRIEGYKN